GTAMIEYVTSYSVCPMCNGDSSIGECTPSPELKYTPSPELKCKPSPEQQPKPSSEQQPKLKPLEKT
ncbi:22951_t:CDS:1, partial [Entrophospora sp. SA101]